MAARQRLAAVVFCLSLATTLEVAAEIEPPTPEQLAAIERVRPQVEAIWHEVKTPGPDDEAVRPGYFVEIGDRLVAIGPDVLPFLTSEVDLADPRTFHYSAYALGRLGGEEADAALRKAIRAADARGGPFGYACKRFAVFGLSLMGAADVMDIMQTGEKTLFGAQMVSDLPQVAHMALLLGSAAAPILERQLESHAGDSKWTEQLENAVLALGYAGDRGSVPKLVPYLSSTYPKIRVQAADSIARLADPSSCDQVVPLLSAKDVRERAHAAAALARWKPEPCYKAMVGRLEVESDLSVRGPLYGAIAAMGGESSLDVFRANLTTGDEYDQAVVIKSIAEIGSKKGLNMLRQMLSSPQHLTVVRAMEAIWAIGGEGAMDTLLAMTSDRRRPVAASAREVLAEQGFTRVAPRVAEDLLSMVREPVGSETLRVPIAERSEWLVTMGYTEPIEDLRKAAAVQTDPEIKAILDACAQRLQLMVKNGEDAAAWAPEASSSVASVRKLAVRRLAEIGSPAAVKALAARLGKSDITAEERSDILTAIGTARTAGAVELVERHLADPAFDGWGLRDARWAAAWAARRIGGERMAGALRESAVRRDGRDWATLVYLALVEKAAAIPMLKTLRVKRLRYPLPQFGRQETLLERLIADLAAGRAPVGLDVPPEALPGH